MTRTSATQERSERAADKNAIRPFHVNVPERTHFFAVCAQVMRRILLEGARRPSGAADGQRLLRAGGGVRRRILGLRE